MIDYLQLMSASSFGVGARRYENRTQEVSAISRGLKALAKELRVPVVALSQLSRARSNAAATRSRCCPICASRARLSRTPMWLPSSIGIVTTTRREREETRSRDKAEIIIAKQRNGPTGSVHLAYLAECTRFENLAFGEGPGEY